MSKFREFCLILLLVLAFSAPAITAEAADGKAAADAAAIAAVMARYDAGELSVEQALSLAIEQDISFEVIISACEARNIPLGALIVAAESAGMSPEVALSKMADAGVSSDMLSVAIAEAGEVGLGYRNLSYWLNVDYTKWSARWQKKLKKLIAWIEANRPPVSPSAI